MKILNDTDFADGDKKVSFTSTQRGGIRLHIGGHTYNKRYVKGKRISWICSNYYTSLNCKVKVITMEERVIAIQGDHMH